jgi:alkyl hydroperoxide reductase subunit F
MPEPALIEQLREHLKRVAHPVTIVAALDDGDFSRDLRALLEDVAELSERIALRVETRPGERAPSCEIVAEGAAAGVRFAGIPLGHELTSFVLHLRAPASGSGAVDAATRSSARSARRSS